MSILFCLKDGVFSAFTSKAKCPVPISTGKGEEAKQKWVQSLPPDFKIFMAGLLKNDFTKQTAHISTFNVGYAALEKQIPQQQSQAKSFCSQSEPSLSQSQAPIQPFEAHQAI